ncbi:MAG: hypothetical protein LBQ83_04145 [Candidatus Margulisbacteria bacterium]|jgi:hypothetical protein|nr:hypothetical protein [Candidatus Margulisiibacteriota bacterium]
MRRLSGIFIICFFLLVGCQDRDDSEPMPYRTLPNNLTNRRALVLTHQSAYVLSFLEQLENRAGRYYSVTIDDLSNIQEYNFAYYNGVLIIETLRGGSAPVLDSYMKIYSGANNIVLHALDGEYLTAYPVSVVTANSADLSAETLQNSADRVFSLLRTK